MELLLDAVEARVLGALIEKEATTPEYYPLSLNALVNACNQKSNRNPVVSYDEDTVDDATLRLREKKLALLVIGSNPRLEAPVLNARIRKRWRTRIPRSNASRAIHPGRPHVQDAICRST